MFSIIHLKLDRARLSLGPYFFKAAAAACVAGLLHAGFEGVGEEAERIKQGTFSRAVFANHRRHRSERLDRERLGFSPVLQATQRHILERLEVLNSKTFYLDHFFNPLRIFNGS